MKGENMRKAVFVFAFMVILSQVVFAQGIAVSSDIPEITLNKVIVTKEADGNNSFQAEIVNSSAHARGSINAKLCYVKDGKENCDSVNLSGDFPPGKTMKSDPLRIGSRVLVSLKLVKLN